MEENKTERLYQNKEAIEAFVGDKKSQWYIKAFEKYNNEGRDKIAWNWSWPAFFVGPLYLMYRKCYLSGIIMYIILEKVPNLFLALCFCFLTGGLAPFIVYRRFKKISDKIDNKKFDYQKKLRTLESSGGTNLIVFIIIFLALFIYIEIATSIYTMPLIMRLLMENPN